MEQNNQISIEAAAAKLKSSLKLEEDNGKGVFFSEISFGQQLAEDSEGDSNKKLRPIQDLSEAAQYVIENNKPQKGFEYPGAYSEEEAEILAAIVGGLPKDELEELMQYLPEYYNPVYYRVWRLANLNQDSTKAEKQLAIATLIKRYKDGARGKKGPARMQLQKRFDYQSFVDQLKIIRAFLSGSKTDREWCYLKLMHWWDDALIVDLEQAWLDHKDAKCVKVAVKHLSEAFIKEHQEEMGVLDYKSVCYRLAYDSSFVIDTTRLTAYDYCYVIAHNHRRIDDTEADTLLFNYVKNILYPQRHYMPFEFRTQYDPRVLETLDDKKRYIPSLMYNKQIGYVVWALGQVGNAPTLIKFHKWHKMIQNNMLQYLSEEKNEEEILAMMNSNFREYQEWNWKVFAKHAYLSLCGFVHWDEDIGKSTEELSEMYDMMME